VEAKSGAGYTPYYYHADGLGSITGLSDATGTMVQTYGYDAFGNVTVSGSGNVSQPFMFTGREYDSETGMYFYRARYYDPQAGRFVTKDPIGFAGGINVFSYVENNPSNFIDPTGNVVLVDDAAIAIGTLVVATAAYLQTQQGQQATRDVANVIGNLINDILENPPDIKNWFESQGKGERNWEKGRGDDPFWNLSPDQLRYIEKHSKDPKERERAKRIRKQKEKKKCEVK